MSGNTRDTKATKDTRETEEKTAFSFVSFVPLVSFALKRESDQNVNLRPSRAIRGFMISSV